MFAQRELGSREVCNREHWSATSDQELVYPVILMLLAEIKRTLVSPAGKQPNDSPLLGGTLPKSASAQRCLREREAVAAWY
jgi:hypothetical protein